MPMSAPGFHVCGVVCCHAHIDALLKRKKKGATLCEKVCLPARAAVDYDIEELTKIFVSFDMDLNNYITAEEFIEMCCTLLWTMPIQMLKALSTGPALPLPVVQSIHLLLHTPLHIHAPPTHLSCTTYAPSLRATKLPN